MGVTRLAAHSSTAIGFFLGGEFRMQNVERNQS